MPWVLVRAPCGLTPREGQADSAVRTCGSCGTRWPRARRFAGLPQARGLRWRDPEESMLTKLKLALLISAPLIAGATTLALAGDGPAHDAVIQKFDKNGDGKLDRAEGGGAPDRRRVRPHGRH